MEHPIQEELDGIESELLLVREELSELLKRQDLLLEKKHTLTAQLEQSRELKLSQQQSIDWENGQFEWSDKVFTILKSQFKLDSFRPLQSSTINATLSNQDAILIMPTGAGKSLCYQLPALVRPGVSLVISPLVSLMEDQVLAVKNLGIESAMLNASASREEVNRVHGLMTNAKTSLKLLYVTPEKLSKSKRFMSKLEKMYEMGCLSRIVIDEIHCASQWGHDFRPDYKILGILKRQFPKVPILGLTATATAKVLADCKEILSIGSCLIFKASYNRLNLFYEVRHKPSSHKAQIEDIVNTIKTKFPKQSGIVYCLSRNNADDVCQGLRQAGISAGSYHTDRLPTDRSRVHRQWLDNSIQVIVATIAFGMGIDKSDVRFIIHHSLSKSMENYYQESGRAGRDGNTAHCILFYRSADAFRQSAMVFTEHTGLSKLSVMMQYCINEVQCRRSIIAESFGEKWTEDDCPGACDVCVKLRNATADVTSQAKQTIYQVTKINVSKHVKDLVAIIEYNQARQQRLTPAKLVDIWRSQNSNSSSKPRHITPPKMTTEQCERVVVTALLQGVLKEDFHYTAYSTICYIAPGRKAELAKKGLVTIELPSLVSVSSRTSETPHSSTKKTTDGVAIEASGSGETPLPRAHVNLPSMLLDTENSELLSIQSSTTRISEDKTQQEGQNTNQAPSIPSGSHKGKCKRGSLGKGKKRRCTGDEGVPVPTELTPKRARPTSVAVACDRDVIEIDDSD